MASSRLVVLVAALVAALAAAQSAWAAALPLCTVMVTTNCVISVEVDGVPQPYPSGGGDTYEIFVDTVDDPLSAYDFVASINLNGGGALPLGQDWELAINTGSTVIGETFARGRDVTIVRGGSAGSLTVTATLSPVRMAGDCGPSGGCPMTATIMRPGELELWIGDLGYLDDPADEAAMRGFDLATSASWVSSPPTLDYATRAIVLDVANPHFEVGGTTPFVGSAEFRLPFAMLLRLYDVDDPASLTPAAFAATAGPGPAPTVSVMEIGTSIKVTMENLRFSKRKLRIRGNASPGRPRNVNSRRSTATVGTIWFLKALPRGSKVRGYQAICRGGGEIVRGSSLRSPLRVRGLGNARYTCAVQAKSRAGLGRVARAIFGAR
jgi:hypothetical protein